MAEVGLLCARVDLRVLSLALGEWCGGEGPSVRRAAACSALADDGRAFSALAALYASRAPSRSVARPPAHSLTPDAHPTPGAARAVRDIARGDLVLVVPHLRLPWAQDLAAALWRTLGVRLDKRGLQRPPTDFAVLLKALKDVGDADAVSEGVDAAVADRFYPALPPDDQQYNAVVLHHLHNVHGHPGVVEKLANLARLSYVNGLLADVRRQIVQANEEREAVVKTLQTNMARYVASCRESTTGGPSGYTLTRPKTSPTDCSVSMRDGAPVERCCSSDTSQCRTTMYPHNQPPPRPLTDDTFQCRTTKYPRNQPPPRPLTPTPTFRRSSCQSVSSARSTSCARSPVSSPRKTCPRAWPQIHAVPVADSPGSPSVSRFILNGVVVPGRLLQNIRRGLAREFRLDVVIGGQGPLCECPSAVDVEPLPVLKLPPAESLAVAQERSAASARMYGSNQESSMATGRCSKHGLDAYLLDRFGMTWTAVCAHAVRVSEVDMCTAKLRELDAILAAAGTAEDAARQVRQDLVSAAVAHEAVTASLSRRCALRLAQQLSGPEINNLYMSLPREVWRLIAAARDRLEELENAETVSLMSLTQF